MNLEKYSIGIGDRFAHQGRAQLDALIKAKEQGVFIVPVWNKSYREHSIIKTISADTRKEADIFNMFYNIYVSNASHLKYKNKKAKTHALF